MKENLEHALLSTSEIEIPPYDVGDTLLLIAIELRNIGDIKAFLQAGAVVSISKKTLAKGLLDPQLIPIFFLNEHGEPNLADFQKIAECILGNLVDNDWFRKIVHVFLAFCQKLQREYRINFWRTIRLENLKHGYNYFLAKTASFLPKNPIDFSLPLPVPLTREFLQGVNADKRLMLIFFENDKLLIEPHLVAIKTIAIENCFTEIIQFLLLNNFKFSPSEINDFLKFNYHTMLQLAPTFLVWFEKNNIVLDTSILAQLIDNIILVMSGNFAAITPLVILLLSQGGTAVSLKKKYQDLDYIDAILKAFLFKNTKLTVSNAIDLLRQAVQSGYNITEQHWQKLSVSTTPEIYTRFRKHVSLELTPHQETLIIHLQNTKKKKTREEKFYSSDALFTKNYRPYNCSLHFWPEKLFLSTVPASIRKILSVLFLGKLPYEKTTHYISYEAVAKAILKSGHIYSADVLGMSYGSNLVITDIRRGDKQLVCTAPRKTWKEGNAFFASITFDLNKLPAHYSKYMVIKLNDWSVDVSNTIIHLTDKITLRLKNNITHPQDIICIFTDGKDSVELVMPGSSAVFYNLKSLRKIPFYIFEIMAKLQGHRFQKEIYDFFEKLGNKLPQHILNIFYELTEYMEIDFLGGVALSFDYIARIDFLGKYTIYIPELCEVIAQEDVSALGVLFFKIPELKESSFFIKEILQLAKKQNCQAIYASVVEKIPGKVYEIIQETTHNFMDLEKLQQEAGKLATLSLSKNIKLDLSKMANAIKEKLKHDNQYRSYLIMLPTKQQQLFQTLYPELKQCFAPGKMQFAGGFSKNRELLTSQKFLKIFTRNTTSLMMILAMQAAHELNEKVVDEFYLGSFTSQNNGQVIHLTLGSMFLAALAEQSVAVLEGMPLNEEENAFPNRKQWLMRYIERKLNCSSQLRKLEDMLGRCYMTSLMGKTALLREKTSPLVTAWPKCVADYQSIEIKITNPRRLEGNVNWALPEFFSELTSHKLTVQDQKIYIPNITFQDLVTKFIHSDLILQPWPTYHMIFDKSHFPIALASEQTLKIKLDDQTISFKTFIDEALKAISNTGVNEKNAIVAEQLALAIEVLGQNYQKKLEDTPMVEVARSLSYC